MIDDLEYWQKVLENAERSLEIMDARGIDDVRSRKAAQMAIEEAKTEIENLS
jgi:hypothetical protein